MSWTDELYSVYEKNCGNADNVPLLLPISHSTANAQIEITLTESGDFVQAVRVEKADAETVIPVTNDSAARSSGIAPHPFADKLVYIAGDYGKYSVGKNSDNTKYFEAYIEQLKNWAVSEHSHKAVKAVLTYLEKNSIVGDLISCGAFAADETGKLKSGEKIQGIAQEDAFVRFKINYSGSEFLHESRTWKDSTLYDSFTAYNSSREQDLQLCYATGKILPVTYKHPSKIRNAGDKGKLISANDESGFAYRGRFQNKEQAISVSYDFSQKMHNALKWLIAKQGVNIENSLTLVVWESAMRDLPKIMEAANGLFDDEIEEMQYADTYQKYQDQLKKSIFGCKDRLEKNSKAMIMGLDSATTGRLSIGIYSELQSSEFLESVEKWHRDTAWYRFNGKKKRTEINSFGLREIAESAFGTEQNGFVKCKSELITDCVCRLVPCVSEKRKLPKDIVRALVNRASAPLKYENYFNWLKVLDCACGMLRKSKIENKEECKMALDENCTERSYLYGRLLAVADAAEARTYEKGENRTTNAKRYFEAFSNRPCTTWAIIRNRLSPYLEKLDKMNKSNHKDNYYASLINTITDMFERDDFADDRKLDPIYLHGYSCQLMKLYGGKDGTNDTNNEEE
ncbi:MAG: type I-C CRISPR-associated protein Cas8c/Csd1 [Prevotella sp.]|nr:type I-C CRISPR-associated protein Cas8c/Csd1 [Prevotella sp.]